MSGRSGHDESGSAFTQRGSLVRMAWVGGGLFQDTVHKVAQVRSPGEGWNLWEQKGLEEGNKVRCFSGE